MNATEELVSIRRRIGGVESELALLKERVDFLEQSTAPAPVPLSQPFTRVVEPPQPAAVVPPALPMAQADSLPMFDRSGEGFEKLPPQPAPAVSRPAQPMPLPRSAPPEPTWLERARPVLERMQLWPPDGTENREVQLGAWWATRLGILFAVIGVVFFGVYISLGNPPWVKLVELSALVVGITGFGAWLERKMPRFGQVVFAGGLATIFFTAMAAHTVPAVKVIDDPLAAAFWQVAVAAGIGAVAWRRSSPPLASMTVVLGFVAAWFSFSAGLQLFALSAALALATLSVVWRRWLKWDAPSILALVGYWCVYATLLTGLGARGGLPLSEWAWGFLVAGFAVFFWRDDRHARSVDDIHPGQEAWVQNVNSTAALALGWLTAWVAFPAALGWFYASAALVLGLAAWRRAIAAPGDVVGAVLLAKALGALTLAVIKWTGPDTTALALMVQAGVMLATNRRLQSKVIAAGSGVVATVAMAYWVEDVAAAKAVALSVKTFWRMATLVGFIAWGLETAKNCGLFIAERESRLISRTINAAAAALALLLAGAVTPVIWSSVWCVLGALLLAGAGLTWKRVESWLAAGAVLTAAHLVLWARFKDGHLTTTEVWVNAFAVLLPTGLAAWWLGRASEAGERRLSTWWVSALALVSLGVTVSVAHGGATALLTLLLTGTALALGSPWQSRRNWLWLATWALGVGTVAYFNYILRSSLATKVGSWSEVRWVAALLPLIGSAALGAWTRTRAQLDAESPKRGVLAVMVWLSALFVLSLLPDRQGAAERVGVLFGFALLASALATWVWQSSLRSVSWVLSLLGGLLLLAMPKTIPLEAKLFAVFATWLPALGWAKWDALQQRWAHAGAKLNFTLTGQTWLAGLVTALAIGVTTATAGHIALFAGSALVLLGLARAGFRATGVVAIGMITLALWQSLILLLEQRADVAAFDEGFAAVLAATLAAVVVARLLPAAQASVRKAREWLFSGAGLALLFGLMLEQRGGLLPYITVGWGVAALAWFGFGVFARSLPNRLLGLVGVALCIPRVFIVDLHSTLYRIAAFGALGVVLLWVGFSYHRFRHFIAEGAPTPDDAGGRM